VGRQGTQLAGVAAGVVALADGVGVLLAGGAGVAVVAVGAGAAVLVPLLSQVTVNALAPVSADGVASVTPPDDTMVSAEAFSSPIGWLSVVAFVKLTVPKFDSGNTVPLLGASAITSAEPSCAVFEVWFVVCVQFWVVSVSVKVNAPPPFATTEALIASPGTTGLL
jgi:hypothetical protein